MMSISIRIVNHLESMFKVDPSAVSMMYDYYDDDYDNYEEQVAKFMIIINKIYERILKDEKDFDCSFKSIPAITYSFKERWMRYGKHYLITIHSEMISVRYYDDAKKAIEIQSKKYQMDKITNKIHWTKENLKFCERMCYGMDSDFYKKKVLKHNQELVELETKLKDLLMTLA